jgi:sigma-B regulation protein RsbU (phosphoserine phosphatase)
MRINFVGSWGAMHHYNFSDVFRAADDRDELALWREELSGKIALISDVSTGSSDVGQIPLYANYPLSGVHANCVHTILTGAFFTEPSALASVFIELTLLAVVMVASLHRSAVVFTLGVVGLGAGYTALSALGLFYADVILPVIRPLLMAALALLAIQVASAVSNARSHAKTENARRMAEKELEIGRQIQAGFFPTRLPAPPGWEIAAYFKPARQVAGDFYDVFELNRGEHIGIVIADVCDKGVGAALFMALIRTLIRAFSIQDFEDSRRETGVSLLNTIKQTNNYIAATHGEASMFATLFLGILHPQTGTMNYVNCGHEPPIITGPEGIRRRLAPTGPALGMMPDMTFAVEKTCLTIGDLLFAFTDGLTDAPNLRDQRFGRQRLTEIIGRPQATAAALLERMVAAVSEHVAGAGRFDDITMLAVGRRPDARSDRQPDAVGEPEPAIEGH